MIGRIVETAAGLVMAANGQGVLDAPAGSRVLPGGPLGSGAGLLGDGASPGALASRVAQLKAEHARLGEAIDAVAHAAGVEAAGQDDLFTRLAVFQGYVPVFIAAFLVTLLATPVMRRLAVSHGVIDRPNEARKVHTMPIAYLGGAAVFLGLMAGILYSYLGTRFDGLMDFHATRHLGEETGKPLALPIWVLLGITVIMLIGLIDDVTGISPRVKVGGQLLAAAGLAIGDVGVKLAAGIIVPLAKWLGIATTQVNGFDTVLFRIPLPVGVMGYDALPLDVVYWTGTAIIAVAVLGMCNASNLIDGLDGLLSGVTGIATAGLLVIALGLALVDDGPRDAQRIVLCLALLGACLGFLPHNFNPATIFLGDTGSMLMGFCTCVIVMSLGDTGKTHLVAAGLIIYAIPIIDMALAVIRRKLSGRPLSAADDQHLHHMLRRAFGVKGAVFTLYGIGAAFAVIGVGVTLIRARSIYLLALVLAAFIVVIAIKIARRRMIEEQAAAFDARRARPDAPSGTSGHGAGDGEGERAPELPPAARAGA